MDGESLFSLCGVFVSGFIIYMASYNTPTRQDLQKKNGVDVFLDPPIVLKIAGLLLMLLSVAGGIYLAF
jgi:hypothetical protein